METLTTLRFKGCRVIGTAGSKEKCDWLVNEAHFDAPIDYKSEDLRVRLSALCPNGIDRILRQRWRRRPQRGTRTHQPQCADRAVRFDLDIRRLRATAGELPEPCGEAWAHRGIHGIDYPSREPEGFEGLGRWHREGKLVQKEDVPVGLEHALRAFMRLFTGESFGKQLVKVADAAA